MSKLDMNVPVEHIVNVMKRLERSLEANRTIAKDKRLSPEIREVTRASSVAYEDCIRQLERLVEFYAK